MYWGFRSSIYWLESGFILVFLFDFDGNPLDVGLVYSCDNVKFLKLWICMDLWV